MKTRVLVVDDEESSRSGMVLLLTTIGYEVESAADGEEAIERARTFRPAVVIADLVMPGVDGLAVLKAVRAELPHAVVIMLTGHASIETAVASMREGAYDYLTKPVEPRRLRALLDKAVEKADVAARGHGAAAAASGGARGGAPPRHESRDARGVPAHRPGRADLGARAHHRGDGHRQGAGGANDSRSLTAGQAAVRGRQLLGHSRDPARERAVRAREGRLHGGDGAAGGVLRAGGHGHHLPRRDHGDEPGPSGQVPAHAAGRGGPAPRGQGGAEGRRTDHRGHQQGAAPGRQRRQLPRGPRTIG